MSRIQWQRQVSIFLNRRTIEFNSCSIFFLIFFSHFFQNHQYTLTWCFLSCFLCRNLFLFVAVFTLTLPRKKNNVIYFMMALLWGNSGFQDNLCTKTMLVYLPLVSLSSWPLLLCFPCLCDLFCCFKAPGRCACCTSAAILSKNFTRGLRPEVFIFQHSKRPSADLL